jgi:hypothetical protein
MTLVVYPQGKLLVCRRCRKATPRLRLATHQF